jgi:hypothetical protein
MSRIADNKIVMTTSSPSTFADSELAELVKKSRRQIASPANDALLDEIIQRYEALPGGADDEAAELRRAFLLVLGNSSVSAEADERFASFLVEEIGPADLDALDWKNPDQVLNYCELLYALQTPKEAAARRVRKHASRLLMNALAAFEKQGELEKMFQLLQRAPTTEDIMNDAKLLHMRNRAYLYEMRRVQRNRRYLYLFLALQLVFILLIFPLLFINAENGAIQESIEEATEADLPEEPERFLSFADGVYWSIVTATTVGYGDITPVTRLGRIIAATLGVMGVVTTGLLAGLILSWVSPRELR